MSTLIRANRSYRFDNPDKTAENVRFDIKVECVNGVVKDYIGPVPEWVENTTLFKWAVASNDITYLAVATPTDTKDVKTPEEPADTKKSGKGKA